VQSFKKAQKDIEKTINAYLDLITLRSSTEDRHGQKFWCNRMLVHIDTWAKINERSDPNYTLKYMPEKFVSNPLRYRFTRYSEHYSKYMEWMLDYFAYLHEICNEPEEGIVERVSGWKVQE